MPDVAGADRDQGVAQRQGGIAAGPRPRSAERHESRGGVFVALLTATDLLSRPVVENGSVRQHFTVRAVARPAYTAFVAAL
ncbi:hypothetical protein [Streptomyces gibsoniae]|uniref:DUF397 domain-containing protein n=1 Tax=Streptomyces gibsoniae TaxID=3075529 RepID=A0ABU2UA41_9ACTN|nr:hypothetical protein [Streptomyces sp. DSM 41699]MDT0470081.1 hypothetical protein [Streptomyces sp. DSM 41699]